jgi:Winged helix DNA-binding domain
MLKLTWDQVLGWRLRRQFVDPPGDVSVGEVVGRLAGVQAQVASAAEMAVSLRQATPDPGGVKRGLAERSLVKTWAMRGTLHVLRASDAGGFLSLMALARTWEKPVWGRNFGASPKEVAALTDAVSAILGGGAVLTRDELVSAIVADQRFAGMEAQLRSGWGALLKPLAWQGALVYGPSQGSTITFTGPAAVIPGWQGLPEPAEAAPAAIAAYLGAYGPAAPEAFSVWLSRSSLRKTTVRGWFEDLGDTLTSVDVEGQPAYILTEHADELAASRPGSGVRLLGAFDQYILGPGTNDPHLLPAHHRAKVSKTAGWISPIVVVDGRVAGVWELAGPDVIVTLFPEAAPPSPGALQAEAARVAQACGLAHVTVRIA